MPSQYDASDFVDSDFVSSRQAGYAAQPAATAASRPPTREEVDAKVSETQVRLAELKRAQEELERERAALEETRRRQIEFQTGREEMLQHLTRGLGLLQEAEFAARRDAEGMARAMGDLQDALQKVQSINDQAWTKENFTTELTRALTTIENARMEWNSARLKFPVLSGKAPEGNAQEAPAAAAPTLGSLGFLQLCKLGFAMTWPLVLLGIGIFVVLLLTR